MRLKEFTVSGKGFKRKVWLAEGPKVKKHKLCILMDGEFYLKFDTPTILKKAAENFEIPRMSYLFVSHKDNQARHVDYTLNDNFAQFITAVSYTHLTLPTKRIV